MPYIKNGEIVNNKDKNNVTKQPRSLHQMNLFTKPTTNNTVRLTLQQQPSTENYLTAQNQSILSSEKQEQSFSNSKDDNRLDYLKSKEVSSERFMEMTEPDDIKNIRLPLELNQEERNEFNQLEQLVTSRRLYMADEENWIIMDANVIVPYKDGFLLVHHR